MQTATRAAGYRLTPLVLFLAALTTGGCAGPAETPQPAEGNPFPALTLKGLDVPDLDTAALQGKVVILHVWATWCPPCRREIPGLEKLSRSLDPQQYAVIGLSVDDDPNLVREFNRKYSIVFSRYIDVDRAVANGDLHVKVFPETFVIGPHGVLLRHLKGEQDWSDPAMLAFLKGAAAGSEHTKKK